MNEYLGIDLGGTNIALGVLEGEKITEFSSVPTDLSCEEALIKQLVGIIKEYQTTHPLKAVGIGVPGIIDKEGRRVLFCANVPLKEVDLSQRIEDEIGVRVHLGNDATVATMAEWGFGYLKGVENGILLTLGTGIGGGAIVEGELFLGANGQAMEPGHMVIDMEGKQCNCGRKGCFEAYASASRLVEYFNQRSQKPLSGTKEIFDLYAQNHPVAIETVNYFSKVLAVGVCNLMNLFDVSTFVFTGGLSGGFETIREGFVKDVREQMILPQDYPLDFYVSQLGGKAGVLGAAFMAKKKTKD